jgi:hypothetical protein
VEALMRSSTNTMLLLSTEVLPLYFGITRYVNVPLIHLSTHTHISDLYLTSSPPLYFNLRRYLLNHFKTI